MSPLATPKFSIVNFQLSIGSHWLPDKREFEHQTKKCTAEAVHFFFKQFKSFRNEDLATGSEDFWFRFVLKAAGILYVFQGFYKQKLDQKNRFTGQDLN